MNTNFVKDYYKENSINNSSSSDVSQKLFGFNNEKILVVDSSSIFQLKTIKPSIVLLKNSPKINLERLIEFYNPKLIIADGSNYKSFIVNWKNTCIKKKTPFYDTSQKGAFIIKE